MKPLIVHVPYSHIQMHFKGRGNHDSNTLKWTKLLKIYRVIKKNCIHVFLKGYISHDSNILKRTKLLKINLIKKKFSFSFFHFKLGQLNFYCGNSSIVKYVVSKSVNPQFSPYKHYIIVANKCLLLRQIFISNKSSTGENNSASVILWTHQNLQTI